MTEPRPLVFRRTPSRSPGRIFAPPMTPIIIDSSPFAVPPSLRPPSPDSLPISSPLRNSSYFPSKSNGGNGTALTVREDVRSNKRVALAQDHGRKNVPVSVGRQTAKERKNSSSTSPAPTRLNTLPTTDARNENGQGKVKKSTKKAGKARKTEPRQSKNTLNKTIKGRVTKSSAESSQSSTKSTKDVMPPPETEPTRAKGSTVEVLQLEEAMRRRSDWTPMKDALLSTIDLTQSPASSGPEPGNNFGDLIAQYGFTAETGREEGSETANPVPTNKRRLELVRTSSRESQASGDSSVTEQQKDCSTKPKKSRKKAITITSLTTAQYETHTPPESNIFEYFSPKAADKRPAPKRKPRARKATAKSKGNSTKAASPAFKVAPAIDAIKSLDDQVLLFGTSSQLARDFSPGSGEQGGGREPSVQSSKLLGARSSKLGSTSNLSKFAGSRSLWDASSRDQNGGLANIEVVNLEKKVPTPVPSLNSRIGAAGRTQSNFIDVDDLCQEPASELDAPLENRTRKIETDKKSGVSQRPKPSLSSSTKRNRRGFWEVGTEAPDTDVGLVKESGTEQSSRSLSSTSSSKQLEAVQPEVQSNDIAQYRGFSTAELEKQVAAFGFKPVKTREAAISLLEKCWESRNKTSSTSNTSTKRASVPPAPPVAREVSANPTAKPGASKNFASHSRKSKSSSSRTSQPSKPRKSDPKPSAPARLLSSFEEISDSTDEDTVLTPSHDIYYDALSYSNQMEMTPPSTLTIRLRGNNDSTPVSSSKAAEDIHGISKQITLAIQQQPRLNAVNGVKQPTWYEKILMYDPILLDDLTVWLNTEGLDRIGEDREVDRLTVREWCESKGVCCTWRKAQQRK